MTTLARCLISPVQRYASKYRTWKNNAVVCVELKVWRFLQLRSYVCHFGCCNMKINVHCTVVPAVVTVFYVPSCCASAEQSCRENDERVKHFRNMNRPFHNLWEDAVAWISGGFKTCWFCKRLCCGCVTPETFLSNTPKVQIYDPDLKESSFTAASVCVYLITGNRDVSVTLDYYFNTRCRYHYDAM